MYLQMLSGSLRACFSSMTCSSRKTFIMRDAVVVCDCSSSNVQTDPQDESENLRVEVRCLKSLLQPSVPFIHSYTFCKLFFRFQDCP